MKILVNFMPSNPKECRYSIRYKEKDAEDYTYFCGWNGCNRKKRKCNLDEFFHDECKYFKAYKR